MSLDPSTPRRPIPITKPIGTPSSPYNSPILRHLSKNPNGLLGYELHELCIPKTYLARKNMSEEKRNVVEALRDLIRRGVVQTKRFEGRAGFVLRRWGTDAGRGGGATGEGEAGGNVEGEVVQERQTVDNRLASVVGGEEGTYSANGVGEAPNRNSDEDEEIMELDRAPIELEHSNAEIQAQIYGEGQSELSVADESSRMEMEQEPIQPWKANGNSPEGVFDEEPSELSETVNSSMEEPIEVRNTNATFLEESFDEGPSEMTTTTESSIEVNLQPIDQQYIQNPRQDETYEEEHSELSMTSESSVETSRTSIESPTTDTKERSGLVEDANFASNEPQVIPQSRMDVDEESIEPQSTGVSAEADFDEGQSQLSRLVEPRTKVKQSPTESPDETTNIPQPGTPVTMEYSEKEAATREASMLLPDIENSQEEQELNMQILSEQQRHDTTNQQMASESEKGAITSQSAFPDTASNLDNTENGTDGQELENSERQGPDHGDKLSFEFIEQHKSELEAHATVLDEGSSVVAEHMEYSGIHAHSNEQEVPMATDHITTTKAPQFLTPEPIVGSNDQRHDTSEPIVPGVETSFEARLDARTGSMVDLEMPNEPLTQNWQPTSDSQKPLTKSEQANVTDISTIKELEQVEATEFPVIELVGEQPGLDLGDQDTHRAAQIHSNVTDKPTLHWENSNYTGDVEMTLTESVAEDFERAPKAQDPPVEVFQLDGTCNNNVSNKGDVEQTTDVETAMSPPGLASRGPLTAEPQIDRTSRMEVRGSDMYMQNSTPSEDTERTGVHEGKEDCVLRPANLHSTVLNLPGTESGNEVSAVAASFNRPKGFSPDPGRPFLADTNTPIECNFQHRALVSDHGSTNIHRSFTMQANRKGIHFGEQERQAVGRNIKDVNNNGAKSLESSEPDINTGKDKWNHDADNFVEVLNQQPTGQYPLTLAKIQAMRAPSIDAQAQAESAKALPSDQRVLEAIPKESFLPFISQEEQQMAPKVLAAESTKVLSSEPLRISPIRGTPSGSEASPLTNKNVREELSSTVQKFSTPPADRVVTDLSMDQSGKVAGDKQQETYFRKNLSPMLERSEPVSQSDENVTQLHQPIAVREIATVTSNTEGGSQQPPLKPGHVEPEAASDNRKCPSAQKGKGIVSEDRDRGTASRMPDQRHRVAKEWPDIDNLVPARTQECLEGNDDEDSETSDEDTQMDNMDVEDSGEAGDYFQKKAQMEARRQAEAYAQIMGANAPGPSTARQSLLATPSKKRPRVIEIADSDTSSSNEPISPSGAPYSTPGRPNKRLCTPQADDRRRSAPTGRSPLKTLDPNKLFPSSNIPEIRLKIERRNNAPRWLRDSLDTVEEKHPNARFEITDGDSIKCMDCKGKIFKAKENRVVSALESHIRSKGHAVNVEQRQKDERQKEQLRTDLCLPTSTIEYNDISSQVDPISACAAHDEGLDLETASKLYMTALVQDARKHRNSLQGIYSRCSALERQYQTQSSHYTEILDDSRRCRETVDNMSAEHVELTSLHKKELSEVEARLSRQEVRHEDKMANLEGRVGKFEASQTETTSQLISVDKDVSTMNSLMITDFKSINRRVSRHKTNNTAEFKEIRALVTTSEDTRKTELELLSTRMNTWEKTNTEELASLADQVEKISRVRRQDVTQNAERLDTMERSKRTEFNQLMKRVETTEKALSTDFKRLAQDISTVQSTANEKFTLQAGLIKKSENRLDNHRKAIGDLQKDIKSLTTQFQEQKNENKSQRKRFNDQITEYFKQVDNRYKRSEQRNNERFTRLETENKKKIQALKKENKGQAEELTQLRGIIPVLLEDIANLRNVVNGLVSKVDGEDDEESGGADDVVMES